MPKGAVPRAPGSATGLAGQIQAVQDYAEENGITQANVDQLKADSADPVVGRLLGKTEDTGKLLGLDRDWLARAIKAVGNYGEIYERNVGEKTPVGLARGKNRLWTDGGLHYALPLR